MSGTRTFTTKAGRVVTIPAKAKPGEAPKAEPKPAAEAERQGGGVGPIVKAALYVVVPGALLVVGWRLFQRWRSKGGAAPAPAAPAPAAPAPAADVGGDGAFFL